MRQNVVSIIFILLLFVPFFYCENLTAGSSRQMAVTVDDLPFVTPFTGDNGPEGLKPRTARLLATFTRFNVPAVGFVNAGKLFDGPVKNQNRVTLLNMWLDAGLELGNHTYSHPDYHHISFPQFKENLIKGEQVLKQILTDKGRSLRYFRHPMLHTGNSKEKRKQLDELLAQRGYTTAPVTIDNSEWIFARAYHNALKTGDTKELKQISDSYIDYMDRKIRYFESQARALFGRDIRQVLLIHANELNADHVHRLLDLIQKRGYVFITLDNALQDPVYRSADSYIGRGGISWLHRWALTKGKKGAFFKGEPETPEFIKKSANIRYE